MNHQLTQDTIDSIRGKNNYRPNALGAPEAYWPSERSAETLDCRDYSQYDDPKD